jgi:formylglycine-generating enzyme required for sulfatase activity
MSADLAARLRALARDHHEGRLNLATYRKLRAPLLDSLELHAGAIDEMAVTQPRSLGRAAAAARSPQVAKSEPAGAAPASKLPRIVVAGVVSLALIGAVGWWAVHRSTSDEHVTGDVVTPTSPVYELVDPFVHRGDWSDARVAAMNVALLELGEREIGAVASEPWFQRFVDDVRKRVKEQQALVQAPLTAKSSPLAALAVTVGLDLNSPDAAIRISAIDPPSRPDASESTQKKAAARPVKEGRRASTMPVAPEENDEKSSAQSRTKSTVETSSAPTSRASSPAANQTPRVNPCRRELIRSRRPFCSDTLSSGKSGPQLALIPAGEFDMGSDAAPTEQPIHRVTIREPFAISVHEISQAEFQLYCTATGRPCAAQPWSGDDYPVVNVSWHDALAYVEWLSNETGFRYRLPSEAQWEYAARAGQTGLVPGGDVLSPTDAHFSMLTKVTAPAPRSQKFKENAFRLQHVLGNLREWVQDGWTDDYIDASPDGVPTGSFASDMRVVRGGSYIDGATRLRLSLREGLPSDTRDPLTGFRVLREVP